MPSVYTVCAASVYTTASFRAAPGQPAARDEERLFDVALGLDVSARLEAQRLVPVPVDIRVWGADGELLGADFVTVCRQDAADNPQALFEHLTRNLPFAQWGRVTVRASNHPYFLTHRQLYPCYPWSAAQDTSEQAARFEFRDLLMDAMLGIEEWPALLENAAEGDFDVVPVANWDVVLHAKTRLQAHVAHARDVRRRL
jgi:hypothetical protein